MSRKSERKKVKSLSCVRLFVTPWPVPTRLFSPWDFPGNSPRVDCHFLLQGIFPTQGSNPGLLHCRQKLYPLSHFHSLFLLHKVKVSDSLRPHGLYPTRLLCPWDFPGNSTGVDCHFLLQGIFPNQGLNPGLPHCRQTLYHLSHQESLSIRGQTE